MKKTKIICTMGPNTNDRNLLLELAKAGMDIARLNFSHGDHEEQLGRMEHIRWVRKETGLPIAMLLDTKGPEIRTGVLTDDKVELADGQKVILTTEEISGDAQRFSVSYKELPQDLSNGNTILIDDGLLELRVDSIEGTEIVCTVISGGTLGSKKGVNIPNVSIKLPALTDKDRSDIIFGIEQGIDFIAASFVRNAEAVHQIRDLLKEHGGSDIQIISKIENMEGVENIDDIIEASDGIMVARGDLGVEVPAAEVPYLQKRMIQKCNEAYKPVITATQMLDSMIRNPRPTRAEVTDVANAIYDGTDAIMLSGETAMGKYPVEAVRTMVDIAQTTELHKNYREIEDFHKKYTRRGTSSAVAYSAVATATNLAAEAILAPSMSGFSARIVSKYKPESRIIGLSPNDKTLRRMQMYWGVKPVRLEESQSIDDMVDHAIQAAKDNGLIKTGDTAVLTAGVPIGKSGITNMMKVLEIE